jgi:hypothetical protein
MNMKNNFVPKTLLVAWTLATAPLVAYLITHGRIRLGVLALMVAIGGLVLGSRVVKWAVVGAMTGVTIGGFGGWYLVELRDNTRDQVVFAVLLSSFVGVFLGTLFGALLAQRADRPTDGRGG